MKRMGPKIEPWGTPQGDNKTEEEVEPEATEMTVEADLMNRDIMS